MALEELIETVKASQMQATAKSEVVKDLEALRDKLTEGFTATEMRTSVIATIVETRELLATVNSYKPISNSLKTSSVPVVVRLGLVLSQLNNSAFKTELRSVREQIVALEGDDLTVNLIALATSVEAAVNKSTKLESDGLVAALQSFGTAINAINEERASNSDAWAQARIDEVFGEAENSVEPALLQQYYDKDTCDTVEKRLMEIFGISAAELPELEQESNEDGKDPDEPERDDQTDNNTDGGIGIGGIAMGSNDEFYDHEGVGYTPYSDAEVFGRYEAHLDTLKRDGEVSHEIRDLLERYFGILRTKESEE